MRLVTTALGLALVLGATACDGTRPALAEDLQRDLDLTKSEAVELAPRRGGTDVVSAIEGGVAPAEPEQRATAPAPTRRAPRVAARAPSPQRAPVRAAPATPAPVAEVAAPEPAEVAPAAPTAVEEVAPAPAADLPRQRPQPEQRAPRGGWWSTGDVIRNAPFPINP
jgi:hypothetical protein